MYYTNRLYSFLEELSLNNNRPWFIDHKEEYDRLRSLWMADLERLLGLMAAWEPAFGNKTASECAYRIYRDVRFSNDKTPYKTFFSAALNPVGTRTGHYGGYYLQMGVGGFLDSGLYGGVWCPPAPMLKKLRHAIVDNIEEFEEIVHAPDVEEYFPGWVGDRLKTIPKGWDRNHPQAELLRMKDYGKFHHCDRDFFLNPDWPERTSEMFRVLKPLIDFLNYSIDE